MEKIGIYHMKSFNKKFVLTVLISIFAMPNTFAADSTRAWGASSNTTTQLSSSAVYHQVSGQSAQIIGTGGDTRSINKTTNSCGVCIYNTNTGNNNSIQGNTATSTNTGSVSSTSSFADVATVSTNGINEGFNPVQ